MKQAILTLLLIWFVIPADHEAAFLSAYVGVQNAETVGVMAPGVNSAGEPVLLTGSHRITTSQATALSDDISPWLQMFTVFPPAAIWSTVDRLGAKTIRAVTDAAVGP